MVPEFGVRAVAWINPRAQNSVAVAAPLWVAARLPGARRDRLKFFALDATLPILPEQNSAGAVGEHFNLYLF